MNRTLIAVSLLSVFLIGFGAGLFTGTKIVTSFSALPENSEEKEVKSFLPEKPLEPLQEPRLESKVSIVAVNSEGQGLLNEGDVEIIDGKGRVLFNTNPFVEPDTQSSLEIAKAIAEAYTGKSLKEKDVIYSVKNIEAELIGGPSAGGAFTVATIAAIQGKKIHENAAMTGTIEADGSIGEVGGVAEKLQAAGEQGKKLFVVPQGQRLVTYYERQSTTEQRGFITITRSRIVPKQLDLVELAKQWNMEVKEAANIKEAVELLIE